MRKCFIVVVAWVFIAISVASCDVSENHHATFKNASSYPVSVTPDGEEEFTLGIDESKTIDYSGDSIQFLYTPANLVKPNLDGNTVTFVDR